jgi:hypothetical protein
MTGQEHEARLRALKTQLNYAIQAAWDEGLTVEVRPSYERFEGRPQLCTVEVLVRRVQGSVELPL